MELLALCLLGGALAVEGTSFGQFMASRPLVAATVAGWIVGDPVSGLLLGAVLELLHLSVVPVGGARFPEVGPAAVVAAATASAAGWQGAGIALGCMMALVWGQLGGWSIVVLRRANGRVAPDPFQGTVTPARVEWSHVAAMGIDLVRGTVLTGVGILVGVGAVAPAAESWPLSLDATVGSLLVAAALPAGVLLRTLGGARRRGVLFAVGAVVGLVGGLLL